MSAGHGGIMETDDSSLVTTRAALAREMKRRLTEHG